MTQGHDDVGKTYCPNCIHTMSALPMESSVTMLWPPLGLVHSQDHSECMQQTGYTNQHFSARWFRSQTTLSFRSET